MKIVFWAIKRLEKYMYSFIIPYSLQLIENFHYHTDVIREFIFAIETDFNSESQMRSCEGSLISLSNVQ